MASLILPRWCPGCGQPGPSLCRACAAEFGHWFRAEAGADTLTALMPVWACAAYLGPARNIILSWKSGRRPDLVAPFGRLGELLGARVAPLLGSSERVFIVPAPSGWRRRWRGHEVVAPFAAAVARGLAGAGIDAGLAEVLHRRGGRHHGLSREQRRIERATAISLNTRAAAKVVEVGAKGAGGVLLVDDVLTTGATLAASAAAAAELGEVRGAIVLAATPKPVQ